MKVTDTAVSQLLSKTFDIFLVLTTHRWTLNLCELFADLHEAQDIHSSLDKNIMQTQKFMTLRPDVKKPVLHRK